MFAGRILTLLLAMGIGLYVFQSQITRDTGDSTSPVQRIDVTAIRMDLLAIAQSERLYHASNGHYANLDTLVQAGALEQHHTTHPGYGYKVAFSGNHRFRVTATPEHSPMQVREPREAGSVSPTFSIDETMEVTRH